MATEIETPTIRRFREVQPEEVVDHCGGSGLKPSHPTLSEDCPACPDCQPEQEGEEGFSFTCCNWDKLSPESKRAVEEIAKAAAGKLGSPLSDEERAAYDAARQSVVDARNAQPPERSE